MNEKSQVWTTPSTKVELWKVEVSSPTSLHPHLRFTEGETEAQKGGITHRDHQDLTPTQSLSYFLTLMPKYDPEKPRKLERNLRGECV